MTLPPLDDPAALGAFLALSEPELMWLADPRGMLRRKRDPRLHHYHRRWLRKRAGGHRLIERPKTRLKAVQRRLLREVLEHVPPDEAACGFVRGRSVLEHAGRHTGQPVVIRLDLEDFFASVRHAWVVRALGAVGYPAEVAKLMAGLCTTSLPLHLMAEAPTPAGAHEVDRHHRLRRHVLSRHLPQGAPTSPALANLCARRLDHRLTRLAETVGGRYSRYADDLVVSGDLARRADRLVPHVAAIAIDCGFTVNFRKTRVMRSNQRQELGGLVVNEHPQVRRAAYDRLRAVLTNCVRNGLEAENRDQHPDFRAHLQGRIAWVAATSPRRGAKLAALFAAVRE